MQDDSGRADPPGRVPPSPQAPTAPTTDGDARPEPVVAPFRPRKRGTPDAPDAAASPADLERAEAEAAVEAAADVAVDTDGGGPAVPAMGELIPHPALRPARSTTCPFLRRETSDGEFDLPVEAPDPANRCTAMGEPVPQSNRQQQLVCLQASHIDCPRYLRGTLVAREALVPPAAARRVPRATLGAIGILVASAAVAVAFVVRNGGLAVPVVALVSPTPTGTTLALASVVPTAAPATPLPSPSLTPAPSPSPTPTATVAPSPSPVSSPTPTARPTSSGGPTADRLALLVRCPGTPDCYVYTIRSGDNLYSIAHWFGVPLDSLYRRNPWLRTTPIRAGMKIELPTPTR